MDFAKEYEQKLTTADEAVKIIKSGDWVDYGWCNGTPDALDKALAKRTDELKDINLRGGILLKPLAVFEGKMPVSTSPGTPGICQALRENISTAAAHITLPSATLNFPGTTGNPPQKTMWLCSRLHPWTNTATLTLGRMLPT